MEFSPLQVANVPCIGTLAGSSATADEKPPRGGIGREIAEILLARGYDLLLVARSLEKLDAIRADFKTIAGEQIVTVLQADLSRNDSPKIIFDFANDRNISVDILVNNAGVGISGAIEDYGISVSCFSPGHTDTNFFDRADISKDSKFYAKKTRVSPKDVAQDAVENMFNGKLSSIHGFKNNALAFLNRISPSRKVTARISKKLVAK